MGTSIQAGQINFLSPFIKNVNDPPPLQVWLLLIVIMCNEIYGQKESRGPTRLSHMKHTKCYLLSEPIDLRQEMTMAAPKIVFIVYGITNPIKFNPKIRIDPAITPTMRTKAKTPITVPAKRTLFPFVFPIRFFIALMLII